MQRSASVTIGLLFVVAIAAAVFLAKRPAKSHGQAKKPVPSASALGSAKVPAPPTSAEAPSPSASDDAGAAFTDGFETFPDGGKVPELPAAAPKQVSFGVIQFAYQGSQFAAKDARTKPQAREKASSTIELAKRDFSAAVAKGDRGSTADAGRIPRGVLEPPIEYHLFTLEKGQVHPEPIDTPRGFWIVRRND